MTTMISELKCQLYFMRLNLLFNMGIKKGDILPFEDDLYERLGKIYFNGIPMSIQIKYLRPLVSPGSCEDRSLFIAMGFEDALWVSGDLKSLELKYGAVEPWHFWVEHDGWVYDPTMLYKFKKELYYKIYMPSNIMIRDAGDYKQSIWYQDIVNTTLDDLRPGGKCRYRLRTPISLVRYIASNSDDQEFKEELEEHLKLIEYDYGQITAELNDLIRKRT